MGQKRPLTGSGNHLLPVATLYHRARKGERRRQSGAIQGAERDFCKDQRSTKGRSGQEGDTNVAGDVARSQVDKLVEVKARSMLMKIGYALYSRVHEQCDVPE